jgi:ABC-type nickel/cobalt efflux system permease component RcnA
VTPVRRGRWAFALTVAAVAWGVALVIAASIGVFVLPVAAMLVVAATVTPARHRAKA